MEKRLNNIDFLRGIGVILVIFGHIIPVGPVRQIIYTFHMPLFFFISGYLLNTDYAFGVFFKKRIKNILVPYFIFSLIMAIYLIFVNKIGLTDVISSFALQKRYTVLWFLTALFFTEIYSYAAIKAIGLRASFVVSILIYIIANIILNDNIPTLPWNIDVILTAPAFFISGQIFRKKEDKLLGSKKYLIPMSIIMFALSCYVYIVFGSGIEFYHNNFGNPLISYIGACAAIYLFWVITKNAKKGIIGFIGQKSLDFFSLQTIFIGISQAIINKMHITFFNEWTLYFITLIITLISTYIVVLMVDAVKKNIKLSTAKQ